MHLSFLVAILLLAALWRRGWQPQQAPWQRRWREALISFCLPPLMVVSAAIAVLWMGHHGTMMGHTVGPWGCYLSRGLLLWAGMSLLVSGGKFLGFTYALRRYPQVSLPDGTSARRLDTPLPFAAQVGLWRSSLVVSRGWLALPTAEQQAIWHHEQAHAHYHDPLWFLGLGILRWLSLGLPRTQALWEELLLLRELRADRWAAEYVDPLLVAEVLVKVTQQWALVPESQTSGYAAFADGQDLSRLEQRVEALLSPVPGSDSSGFLVWLGAWLLAALPLLAVGLHH